MIQQSEVVEKREQHAVRASHAKSSACVAGNIKKFDAVVSGSGSLQASGLQAAGAVVRLSGPGSATLGGSIGELSAEVSGSGDLEAGELHVQRATVKARGPGGIELAGVSDTLDAELHGSGGLDAEMRGKRLLLKITGPGAAHLKGKVELVKARIETVAAKVRNEMRTDFTYRLGVMVETPRAALRAGDLAEQVSFLSFGTNDLTQMTYGLSRDDAGRFMSDYVGQGVYEDDPFHILDQDGVGELVAIGTERGRIANPDITISFCGEHGGNPESIAFCLRAGVSYVSCSPYRVPVARLAAAQESILEMQRERQNHPVTKS